MSHSDWVLPIRVPGRPPEPIRHERSPENLEYPMTHETGWITPTTKFFRRNHFEYPSLNRSTWQVYIGGEVRREVTLSLSHLEALPRTTLWSTLECSGNKRSRFTPSAEGTPWRDGAVGNAQWSGPALQSVLGLAGPGPDTVEALFTGADSGTFKETGEHVHYQRSLPLTVTGAILALEMNGEPIPAEHGGPVRLLVPQWYGMASVKWVQRIDLLTRPFAGPFQSRDYVYLPRPGAHDRARPVTFKKTNSIIIHPGDGAAFKPGRVACRGLAWTGQNTLRSVEVSLDSGQTWLEATFTGPSQPDAWQMWQYLTPSLAPGSYELAVRARDAAGETQPERAPWNAKGYGNNEIARAKFSVSLQSRRQHRSRTAEQ